MTLPLRLCVRRTDAGPSLRETTVSLRVPSDVSCIEEVVQLVTLHCLHGLSTSPRTRFRLQVCLSEALANAVVSGNRENPDKSVHVQVEIVPGALRIEVRDEGGGFDLRAVPECTDADRLEECSGRGLFIIEKLVDAVEFNEQGNRIRMTLRTAESGGTAER